MNKVQFYKWMIALLLISNLVVVGFSIYYTSYSRSFDPDKPKRTIIERLHLDEQQISQYEHLVQEHRNQVKNKDKEIRRLKNELYALLPDEQNTAQADSLINLIVQKQKEVEYIHFNHFTDIKKLCKPEQMAAYRELVKDLTKIFKQTPKAPK